MLIKLYLSIIYFSYITNCNASTNGFSVPNLEIPSLSNSANRPPSQNNTVVGDSDDLNNSNIDNSHVLISEERPSDYGISSSSILTVPSDYQHDIQINDIEGNINHNINEIPIQGELELGNTTLSKIDGLSNNWQETNNILNENTKNWNQTNNEINDLSQQWGKTNQHIENISKPENVAALSATTGAAFVIGSSIASLAISLLKFGTSKLYNFIHEKITKKKHREKIISEFHIARDNYEKSIQASLKLEKVILEYISIQNKYKKEKKKYETKTAAKNIENALATLDYKIAYKKNIIQTEILNSPRKGISSFKSLRKLEKEHQKLDELLAKLTQTRNVSLCELIREFTNDLLIAEEELENFRIHILVAKKYWLDLFGKSKKNRKKKSMKWLEITIQ